MTLPELLTRLALYAFPILVMAGGVGDWLTRRIPNVLVLALLGLFFAAAPLAGMPLDFIGYHVLAGAGLLAACFVLFARGYIGGGDAKFIAVIGLWLGPNLLIHFLLSTAWAGTILALVYAGWMTIQIESDMRGLSFAERVGRIKLKDIPYGIAIAAGALLAYPDSWWLRPPAHILF